MFIFEKVYAPENMKKVWITSVVTLIISTGNIMLSLISPICQYCYLKPIRSQTKGQETRQLGIVFSMLLFILPTAFLNLTYKKPSESTKEMYWGVGTYHNSMQVVAFNFKSDFMGTFGGISYSWVALKAIFPEAGMFQILLNPEISAWAQVSAPGGTLQWGKKKSPNPEDQGHPSQEMATSDFRDNTNSR